ncbi:MAG: hypothetical protein WC913_08745 [Desulfuromonas sp.]
MKKPYLQPYRLFGSGALVFSLRASKQGKLPCSIEEITNTAEAKETYGVEWIGFKDEEMMQW